MPNELPESLEAKYNATIQVAHDQARWYAARRNGKKNWSKTIRLLSIGLLGLGGIFPLVKSIHGVDVTNWGYITIAAAGTILFVDRFFGFSSGWIRYTVTEMEIYKQIREFEHRWEIEMLKLTTAPAGLPTDKLIELITMCKDFTNQIDELVKQETNSWAAEFQTNITELQKMAEKGVEANRPASVRVLIKNPEGYTNLKLHIDGIFRKEMISGETLVDNCTKGPHLIDVSGQKDGTIRHGTSVIELEAGKMGAADIKMP